jgi:hypothetical protein
MPKRGNAAEGVSLRITISKQSEEALEQIAARGIYGRNPSEVAARFVDQALQGLVQFPAIVLKTERTEERQSNG